MFVREKPILRVGLVFISMLVLTQCIVAQDTAYIHKQTDIIDIANKVFHKDLHQRTENISSLHLSAVPAAGYSLQTGWAGVLSANIGFYDEKHPAKDAKISSILTSVTYSQYSQIILPVQASIWARKDKYNIITDWRYMEYPSTTFGLGGKSNFTDGSTIDFNYIKLHQAILKRVKKDLFAGIGYYFDYFWNVRQVDVPLNDTTDFQKYGLTKTSSSSGIALRLLFDSRLNQINPAQGWYSNIVFRPNFTFLGSDNNWQSLLVEVRKYFPFPVRSKNVLALWSYNWITMGGKPPYLMLPSTGWDDFFNTGRGYIQGRYRGRNMVYFESEYRFAITNNGLFGGVVFANAQSFSKDLSKQLTTIAPGYGAGVRIKLNKFSGANLCIDYGIGIEGSRGISVNLGEVF
jgi:hypothetical protein